MINNYELPDELKKKVEKFEKILNIAMYSINKIIYSTKDNIVDEFYEYYKNYIDKSNSIDIESIILKDNRRSFIIKKFRNFRR